MVRLKFRIELKYEIADRPSDFIFNIHAAQTPCQSLVMENFLVSQPVAVSLFTDPAHGNRYARLRVDALSTDGSPAPRHSSSSPDAKVYGMTATHC